MHMYYEALELYETEGKEAQGSDVYRQAVACLVKAKKYGECVELLMRFGAACDKTGAKSSQCKAYLGEWPCGRTGAKSSQCKAYLGVWLSPRQVAVGQRGCPVWVTVQWHEQYTNIATNVMGIGAIINSRSLPLLSMCC